MQLRYIFYRTCDNANKYNMRVRRSIQAYVWRISYYSFLFARPVSFLSSFLLLLLSFFVIHLLLKVTIKFQKYWFVFFPTTFTAMTFGSFIVRKLLTTSAVVMHTIANFQIGAIATNMFPKTIISVYRNSTWRVRIHFSRLKKFADKNISSIWTCYYIISENRSLRCCNILP